MKRICIIFLLFSPLMNIFLNPQSVSFTKQLPENNEKCKSLASMKMNFEINMIKNGEIIKTLIQSNNRTEIKEEIILESNNNIIKKIKVYYINSEGIETQNNEEKKTTYPVSKKTYTIENINNTNEILYLNGETPTEEEINYIKDDYKDINNNFQTSELENVTLKEKERVQSLESELIKQFGLLANKDNKIETYIYYKKNDLYNNINCAIFDIKINLIMPLGENIELKFEITGEFLVDIDTTWPILVNLNGPITANGYYIESDERVEIKGKGNLEIIISNSFSRYNK